MPQGGCLQVRMRHGTDWRSGSRCVRIAIADNGSGIPAETRRRIFEPFFTTKDGVGTGLGLWVASEIVEKHGGTIRLKSRADAGHNGSVFSIVLPYPAADAGSSVAT
jgi:signal transduction histidine kinase